MACAPDGKHCRGRPADLHIANAFCPLQALMVVKHVVPEVAKIPRPKLTCSAVEWPPKAEDRLLPLDEVHDSTAGDHRFLEAQESAERALDELVDGAVEEAAEMDQDLALSL